ncbi:MAG: hypothetical protein HRT51_10165 [Colwellia sp.]|nr:hypothetical protein [Colwellia sp.]
MKVKYKYVCVSPSQLSFNEGDITENISTFELEQFLEFEQKLENIIVVSNEEDAVYAAPLCCKFGVKLQINDITYPFIKTKKKQTSKQVARELIRSSREKYLLDASLCVLTRFIDNEVPLEVSQEGFIDSIVDITHTFPVYSKSSEEYVRSYLENYFTEKFNESLKFISVTDKKLFNLINLSFKKDLARFISTNPNSTSLLNQIMGAGKTILGTKRVFEIACRLGLNPVLITPDVALANQLSTDERNYLTIKRNKSLEEVNGLVTCVVSLVSNKSLFNFAKNSQLIIIEEFELCESLITQRKVIQKGSLIERSKAMSHFYGLIKEKTVLIADAFFSEFSARSIIEVTGNKLNIIHNSDPIIETKRIVNVMNRNYHVDYIINKLDELDTVVTFNDGSQQIKNDYFVLLEVVKEKCKEQVCAVEKEFMKGEEAQELLSSINDFLEKYHYVQFSPVLTAGINFLTELVKQVNIFSYSTILPLALLQASARFRLALIVNISFDAKITNRYSRSKNLPTNFEDVFNQEVTHKIDKNELVKYRGSLKESESAKKVINRICHNNKMRENYVATTLNMYKAIGYEVNFNYEFSNNSLLKEGYIKHNIKRIESYIDMSKSLKRENVLSSNSNFQSEAQYHIENALDFINFYNLFDVSEEDIMECDKFDRLGKGRTYVANFSLLNNSDKVHSDSNKFIRHCIYLKTFEILGVDNVSLEGGFRKESIAELQRYYRNGYIDINGVQFSVATGLKGTLKYTSTNKTYLSKVVSNFLGEQFGLKLASKTINVKGVDDNYEYWIDQSSADELLRFYSMVKPKVL